jgi:hypothetical protein
MNIEDKRLGVTEGEPSVSSSVVEEEGEQLESETSTDSDSDERYTSYLYLTSVINICSNYC